jgi:capsular polysaccharide biosynthesis protein
MLNPDVVMRLRSQIAADPQLTTFEGYALKSSPLRKIEPPEIRRVAVEQSWSGELCGPDRIFGVPTDGSCLSGIGIQPQRVPEKCLFEIRNGRIIGNNAVIDIDGGMYFPDVVSTDDHLRSLLALNLNNHQGYVAHGADDTAVVHFVGRPERRTFGTDVLFLHNMEPGNYGSFLFRQLPQIIFASKVPLTFDGYVVPDRLPWLYEALRLCGMPEKPIYTVREVSGDLFRKVYLCNSFDAEGVLSSQTTYGLGEMKEHACAKNVISSGERIYVSRALTQIARPTYRQLQNEEMLMTMAKDRQFEILYPETLSLAQQIQVFAKARIVVGPSGSGMLNACFCHPSTRLLDMESFHFTVRQHSKIYGSAKLTYSFLFGKVDEGDNRPLHVRNWAVPAPLAEEGFEWLLSSSR